jgi:serine/threonine protein kinase
MTNYSGRQLGRYRLLQVIGSGGFADVYLALDRHDNKVAIKVFHEHPGNDKKPKLLKEARSFRLSHPNIISILDFGEEYLDKQSTPFIVMTYASKGNLRQRHPRKAQVALSVIVSYVVKIADALSYLHHFQGEKLVHGDVKPENILVGENDEILLGDFGTVMMSSSDRDFVPSKQDAVGTIHYMAPEQLKGTPCRASDQYSLGVMVYEWLTGVPPLTGTFVSLSYQHLRKDTVPPPLRERLPIISPEIEQVVMKALAKSPEERFPTIREFATALEKSYKETLEQIIEQGNSYYQAKQYEDAKKAYSHALELCPTEARVHSRRGDAHRHLEEYSQAIDDYERVLKANPKLAPIWNSRGAAYHGLKEYQKALNDYEWALELDPFYELARLNRERALKDLKDQHPHS